MKKKVLFFMMMLAGCFLISPKADALSEPTRETVGTQNCFFANGVAITIRDNGGDGALIVWDGGEQAVTSDTTVFGGSHLGDVSESSITMTGGTVKNIVGGGLHGAKTTTTNVEIKGGTVSGFVYGGGSASFSGTEADTHPWYSGNADDATTTVGEAHLIISAGSINTVYGGGEGISRVETVNIEVTGGRIAYLCAGGSNGKTGKASVKIDEGVIGTYVTGNRGIVEKVETEINGGELTNLYVAADGEEGAGWVDDATIGASTVEVNGGKITNAYVGYSGGSKSTGRKATDVAVLLYNKNFITNLVTDGFNPMALIETITVTFHSQGEEPEDIQLPKGTTMADEVMLEIIKACKDELGDLYGGLYLDEGYTKAIGEDFVFDNEADVYIKTLQASVATPAPDNEENPETADMGIIGAIVVLFIGSMGLGYTIRKRRFN